MERFCTFLRLFYRSFLALLIVFFQRANDLRRIARDHDVARNNPVHDAARAYAHATPAEMADLGEALFSHWTRDSSAVAFRRMLSIERFRDERAAQVYDELFVTGQLRHHEAVFSEMMEIGALEKGDVEQMALDFWAPIHLLMQATDNGMSMKEATTRIRAHVLSFARRHARNCDE